MLLDAAGGKMSIKRWTKCLITRVLHITQSQWIHHNSLLYQKEHSHLEQQQQLKKKVTKDIMTYLDTDLHKVQEKSRHLL